MKQKKALNFIIIFLLIFVVLFYVDEFKEIHFTIRTGLAFLAGLVGFWNCKN